MALAKGRATERTMDTLHRLTAKAITTELKRLLEAKEAIPAGLITASTQLLKTTGTTAPQSNPGMRPDRLADVMASLDGDNGADDALADFTPSGHPNNPGP